MNLSKKKPQKLLSYDYLLTEQLEMATHFCDEASYFHRENLHAYHRSFHLENHHCLSQLILTTKEKEEFL